jgi:hypothetical protein
MITYKQKLRKLPVYYSDLYVLFEISFVKSAYIVLISLLKEEISIQYMQGFFFSQIGEAAKPLILGKKLHSIIAKGE